MTSALSMILFPLIVKSSGSPGPAPINDTIFFLPCIDIENFRLFCPDFPIRQQQYVSLRTIRFGHGKDLQHRCRSFIQSDSLPQLAGINIRIARCCGIHKPRPIFSSIITVFRICFHRKLPMNQKAGFLTCGFGLCSALHLPFSPFGNGFHRYRFSAYSDRIVQDSHLIPFSVPYRQHFLMYPV